MNTPAGWYPQPGGQQRYWDGQQWTNHFAPSASRRKSPALIVLLSSAGALFAVALALGTADKKTITDTNTPHSPVTVSIAIVWVFAGLVLLFIAIANSRIERWLPRAIVLILIVPVVTAAIFSTVKLNEYSSSGLIQNTQRIYADREHTRVALKETGFAACAGKPVTGAMGKSPRSLVVFDDKGEFYAWNDVNHRGWAPRSVAGLKFVVCVGKEESTASWCNYEGGYSYKVIKFTREVRIVAAEDGQLSKSTVLSGNAPECVSSVSGNPNNDEGDHVGEQQVIEYVASAL